MLLGLLLFTACLLLQVHTLWSSLAQHDSLPTQRRKMVLPAGAAVLGLLHAAGLFSTSFLLAEGQMVCFLVAAFSLLLLHAALMATLQQSSAEVNVQAHSGSGFDGSARACSKLFLTKTTAIGADGPSQKDSFDGRSGTPGHSVGAVGCGRSPRGGRTPVQQMRWNRHCSHAVLLGVGLLVCNAVMGSMGLVVRTGHDAMHKAAPAQEPAQQNGEYTFAHLVSPGAGNQSDVHAVASTQWLSAALLQTQDLLAPLVCALIFPFVLLDANAYPVSTVRSHRSSARLHVLAVQSLWFSYCVLALYWVICRAGQAGVSVAIVLKPFLTSFKAYFGIRSAQSLHNVARCVRSCVLTLSRCLHQPFHLLMPHLVFLSSALSMTTLLTSRLQDRQQSKDVVKHETNSSNACTFIAALTAPILLVLGPSKGLVSALALLQCTCVVRLLQYAKTHHSSASTKVGADGTAVRQSEGWLGVAEGCLWALLSMQLFFCSGHFCEFAGLQYAAGEWSLLDGDVQVPTPMACMKAVHLKHPAKAVTGLLS